jgi:hypothetical protein
LEVFIPEGVASLGFVGQLGKMLHHCDHFGIEAEDSKSFELQRVFWSVVQWLLCIVTGYVLHLDEDFTELVHAIDQFPVLLMYLMAGGLWVSPIMETRLNGPGPVPGYVRVGHYFEEGLFNCTYIVRFSVSATLSRIGTTE